MKSYILAMVVLVALLAGVLWLMYGRTITPSVTITPTEEARFNNATTITYQSDEGAIAVAYVGDLARISGGTYDGMVLRQVVSASGAKYEAPGLALWTKENEIRIETPQQVVYTGTEVSPAPAPLDPPTVPEVLPPETATTTATTTSVLRGVTWLWREAVVGEDTLTPDKPGQFSVTFETDGRLTGRTDCNGFGGDYTITDATITLGDFMTTLMYCEGSQESLFTGLLTSPLSIEALTADTLVLKNSAGGSISFVRSN